MFILLTLLLIVAVLLEGTLTSIPITLGCLICLAVMRRDTSIFLPAFLAGLFIDMFHVHQIGITSIFYISFLFLILLYKKKYEIYSSPFILMASFFGAFLMQLFFGAEMILIKSLLTAVFSVLLFAVLRFFADAKEQQQKSKFLPV